MIGDVAAELKCDGRVFCPEVLTLPLHSMSQRRGNETFFVDRDALTALLTQEGWVGLPDDCHYCPNCMTRFRRQIWDEAAEGVLAS